MPSPAQDANGQPKQTRNYTLKSATRICAAHQPFWMMLIGGKKGSLTRIIFAKNYIESLSQLLDIDETFQIWLRQFNSLYFPVKVRHSTKCSIWVKWNATFAIKMWECRKIVGKNNPCTDSHRNSIENRCSLVVSTVSADGLAPPRASHLQTSDDQVWVSPIYRWLGARLQ